MRRCYHHHEASGEGCLMILIFGVMLLPYILVFKLLGWLMTSDSTVLNMIGLILFGLMVCGGLAILIENIASSM